MSGLVFLLIAVIAIYVVVYRKQNGENVYKYISRQARGIYDQYAPFSYKVVRKKIIDLGQDYTPRQYVIQIAVFTISAAVISYIYFYSVIISIFYVIVAVTVIPYLTFLR